MRIAVICTEGNVFNRRVLPAHVASFAELVGIVSIREPKRRLVERLRHEWRRSGWRVADVVAFRLYYRAVLRRRDAAWIARRAGEELAALPPVPDVPVHETEDPNSEETRTFLQELGPDLTIAACKTILRREIFEVARHGTYVVHPGVCPEYRNAHGCFWALARRDLGRVGSTLLRIDEGVDTGPIYGHYLTPFDEREESHVVIQLRSVYDNMDRIASDLRKIFEGSASPIDVSGRESAAWGQPRLSDYLRWKRAARRGAG